MNLDLTDEQIKLLDSVVKRLEKYNAETIDDITDIELRDLLWAVDSLGIESLCVDVINRFGKERCKTVFIMR